MFRSHALAKFLTSSCLAASFLAGGELSAQGVEPSFESEVIDDDVKVGYGVALGDVDGDGKKDIILADKKAFVWYRNPDWKRFVMTEDLTQFDNVCIAARDIDGDGRVEVAVGAQWNPGDTLNSGSVHYLVPPADRTQKWKPIELHHEPTVHRMRWLKLDSEKFVLVVAPLHGKGNRNGQGAGVKLLAYEVPGDVADPWKTTLIDDSLHMTHNFDPVDWDETNPSEEILLVGREGARLIRWLEGKWSSVALDRVQGGGEIRAGVGKEGDKFLATIEPMHGNRLVIYPTSFRGENKENIGQLNDRIILDDQLKGGHAIATGDLLHLGHDQVVAGWRDQNADEKVGVKIYWTDASGKRQAAWIDDNGMATEDIRLADLDDDGRLDIVAAGRATNNLKVYWNRNER